LMLGGLFAFMTYKVIRHWLKKMTFNPMMIIMSAFTSISIGVDWLAAGSDGYYFY